MYQGLAMSSVDLESLSVPFSIAGDLSLDALTIDIDSGAGGTEFSVGGTLTITSYIDIGNPDLSAATTVSVGAIELNNSADLSLTGSSSALATLEIASAAGLGTPGELTGQVTIAGDAVLEFDGGGSITTIDDGASLWLIGPNAFLADTQQSVTSNSALTGLATNAGYLYLQDTSITTTGDLDNTGWIYVDAYVTSVDATLGGSTLTIGGALTNSNFVEIGSDYSYEYFQNAATLVKAASLDNTGNLYLYGNETASQTGLTTLDVASVAGFGTAGELTGQVYLSGDALLEFDGGGSITTIDEGASLSLNGPNAFLADTQPSVTSNTALSGLATNAGTLSLEDTSLTTTGDLDNTGTGVFYVDNSGYVTGLFGGSAVTIGGTLANGGTVDIGSDNQNASTTVTAANLDNTGNLYLYGNDAAPPTVLTTLDVASAAGFGTAGELTGNVSISGDALLEFDAGGSITTIEAGASLSLYGPNAFLADTQPSVTSDSALTGLATNAGTLSLQDTSLTTTGDLDNTATGVFYVDDSEYVNGVVGGSAVTIGGTLTNSGTVDIGGGDGFYPSSNATTVSIGGLYNTGTIDVNGYSSDATATLSIGGGASSQDDGGAIYVNADADLDILAGAQLTISDTVSDGVVQSAGIINGAGTLENEGTLILQGDSSVTGSAPSVSVLNVVNDGTIEASGGMTLLGTSDAISGSGTIVIDAGSTLEIASAISGNTIEFTGSGETLQIDDLGSIPNQDFNAPIEGFVAGDIIKVEGPGTINGTSYDSETKLLNLTDNGQTVATIDLIGNYAGDNFTAVVDPNDSNALDVAFCFMVGTMIKTPQGEVPVETLKRGDMVTTIDGRAMPVSWIGRQTVSTVFADPLRISPIRIKASALADNVPSRDLSLSPDHAILIGEILIQAGALVNGTSIVRETNVPKTFTYWHVELEDHSLILAQNTAAETFVDNLDRLAFDN
jgi:Hint domain